MPPEKPVKPTKPFFTDGQIRVKAYELSKKNKGQSPEENLEAAVKALEREKFWRPLISVWRWTGIGEKKGWDIVIQLLSTVSIPVLLLLGTQYFTDQNNKQQLKIAEEKQKDELLKTYINDMKASLLDKDHPLKDSKKNSESRSIARTITLTTLAQLNSEQDQQKAKEGKYNQRKGLIMQFLYESGIIEFHPITPLNTADFTFANLKSANLKSANLSSADLSGADLSGADLIDANLESANLIGANLESANLYGANLDSANLNRANLNRASLFGANLTGANLDSANLDSAYLYSAYLFGANLTGADLSGADLNSANLNSANLIDANLDSANLIGANLDSVENSTNTQVKSACFWEKAIYTASGIDETNGWIAEDPKANQRRIDEIKQDKASDPPTPPDCSMWK